MLSSEQTVFYESFSIISYLQTCKLACALVYVTDCFRLYLSAVCLSVVKENSHQIPKLAERKMQVLVSSYRKLTVQRATDAENGPQVIQKMPRINLLSVLIWK